MIKVLIDPGHAPGNPNKDLRATDFTDDLIRCLIIAERMITRV